MTPALPSNTRDFLGLGDKTGQDDFTVKDPSFGRREDAAPFPMPGNPQNVDLDSFDDKTRKERASVFRVAAQELFRTDVTKLDDAGAWGLYHAVTESMFGLADEDGSVAFGKRASKDPRQNIEMLRKFVKGDYALIEDPEYTKWRQMDDEAKLKYALENERTGNKLRSYMKGERGAGFWENMRGGVGMSIVGLPAGAVAFQPDYIRDQNEKIAMESARRSNYETLTDEEKEKYRADVVADYDEKLSRRQTLATFLQFAHGLSDRAGYLLAKSFGDGTPDAANIEGLPEDERDRVYAAFSLMRGDQKKGRILGIQTDFTDDTVVNRLQLGFYGFQQSVVGLVTDTGGMARDAAMWAYAKCAMDEAERKAFFQGWDANVRAEQAMKQNLPDASGIVGEAFQGLAENLHWFIPYSMIGKGGKMAKGAQAIIARAGLQKEIAEGGLTLAKAAAEASRTRWLADVEGAVKAGKGAKRISEFSSAIAMRRQLAAVDQYTAALREIPNVVKAAKWKDAAGAGMWAAGEASAFSAFASEYIANADAAGISREESVLTAAAIGLINAKIEQLYVPGLESSLAPAQIKSLTFAAMAQAIKTDGAAGFRKWLANRVSKGVTEGVKVTLTEGAVEEPLQQMAIEHGKAFDKLCGELRANGQATLANEAKALWDSFARTLPNDYATFIDTAADMVPSSLGFGVTTIGNMTRRQHIHNAMTRHANRRAGSTSTMMTAQTMQELQGATDYDAGLVDVIQQAVNVRAAVEKHWQGEEDGGEAKNPHRFEEAITAARRAWRNPQTRDAVQEIADAAGVDVKTAEVLAQYLQTEAEAAAFSPQARAWTSLNMSLADIDEATIKTVLPGYVEGSFASDPENGIYSGRVRMDDGTEKTIAYRVGDLSAELVAEAQNMAKADSSFGKSFDARHAELSDGVTWASLSDAQRYAEAMRSQASVNGFSTGKSGVFELTDAKGEKVRVNADDIIYLANGRIGDIGYGPAATQGTVRHETFHSLWRFVRGTLADADVQQLAKTLGIDVTKDGWEVELDEKMAHEMERYASGHYVSHAVSSRFDKMLDSWAGKIINFFGQFGPSDEVTDPKTGKPYQLKGLYDSILRGELGSGALGVELRKVPQQTAERTATPTSSMPVEVTDADRAEAEAGAQAEADESANEEEKVVQPQSPKTQGENATVDESGATAPKVVHTAENPADASTPNQVYYRVGLPNSPVKLVGRLEVRDASTGVITSTDADYHDRGNQNRDDKSEESRALVEKIGANPDPLQVGTVQPIASNGIVWALPNGDIIIGNHRVNGVRLGYEKGTAGELEKFVREDAAKRGIEIGADVKKPLLVFVLERIESPDGKADVHEVVRLANESQNRGFNVREQASNDAKILIDNNLLPRMAFRADGRIDETKSGDAIGKFRQESGAQGLIAEDGSLTEEGQTRIQNAALAALLGGEGNNALLQKIMSNAGRLDMQNEVRALMKMTPELMALADAKPGYDLRGPLAEALQLFTEWRDKDETSRVEKGKTRHDWREMKDGRRVRGLSWEAFMSQGDMFRQPSDEAKILGDLFAKAEQLRSFDREDVESAAGKKRVIDLISDYLTDYIKNARAVNTDTDDMFGGTPASRAEVMAAQRALGESGARFSIAAQPAGRNKSANVSYPDAGEEISAMRFSIGTKRREEYSRLLAKHRPDLRADAILDELDKYNNPKKEKLALHWIVRGTIWLPYDESKVDQAIEVAEKAKVDPFKYASPLALIDAHSDIRPTEKRIDPATVPELTDARDEGNGVVSYAVQDDRAGQAAMRRIIDTHWGKDANPWCLLARGNDASPEVMRAAANLYPGDPDAQYAYIERQKKRDDGLARAWEYWNHYNALPKRVAFKDGKLLAFMATEGMDEDQAFDDAAYGNGGELARRLPGLYAEYEAWADSEEGQSEGANFYQWLEHEHYDELREALDNPSEEWWDRQDESHIGHDGLMEIAGAKGGIRYSIAGNVAASNMGIKGAGDAEAMEKAGADREEIWRKTGWWRGNDGKWRVEVPDVPNIFDSNSWPDKKRTDEDPEIRAKINDIERRIEDLHPVEDAYEVHDLQYQEYELHDLRLGDFLKGHPLLKAYPELAEWVVNGYAPRAVGLKAGTSVSQKRIDIGRAFSQTEEAHSIFLHELQHAIQSIEGFAPGLQGGEDTYHRSVGEVEARNVQRRLAMTPEERAATPPWATEDVPTDHQIVRYSVSTEGLSETEKTNLRAAQTEAQRQYDEVVARYTNPDGTRRRGWMRAPNGQPTKLTERQWVQVRTPAFKAWFGDWEAAANRNALGWYDVADVETITGMEPKAVPDVRPVPDKAALVELFKSFGEVRNIHDGRVVRFPARSAGKMVYKKNVAHAFKTLFESSIKAFSEKETLFEGHKSHPNVSAYHHYINKFKTDAGTFYIRFTVRDDHNGSNVHNAEISDVEIYNENGATQFGNQTDGKLHPTDGKKPFVDNKIAYFLAGVNGEDAISSKVVDENGEPLVVAHSTDASFTIFRDMQKNDAGWLGAGFYFFGDRSLDGQYGDNVMECFLNVRNPYYLSPSEHVELAGADSAAHSREFSENLRADGYDGVYFNGDGNSEYAVFSPSQIKSATDNTGAFDWSNPDIRYSIGGVYTGTAADYANRSRQGGVDDGSSVKKIGTGEGSQVYGWGLYGSTVRGVAEGYARQGDYKKNGKPIDVRDEAELYTAKTLEKYKSVEAAINGVRESIHNVTIRGGNPSDTVWPSVLRELKAHGSEYSIRGEHIYEQTFFTDRAPGDESHLLKWYDAISDANWDRVIAQAEKEGLREKLKGAWWLHFNGDLEHFITDNGNSGDAVYERLSKLLGGPQSASEFLARAGIDGVKYPVDSYGGKGVKNGDKAGWNYVSFRDDNIRVDHKWTDGQQRYSIAAPTVADQDVQVAKESAEQRYSVFAGEKTATPHLLKPLAEAKAMLGDGEYTDDERREIYDKTGWWRGKDGKWRVELPNLKAKYFDADESVEFADADVILEKYGWNEYSAYWLRDLVTFPKGLKANTYELGETLVFFVDEEQMKSASGGEDASAATFVRVEQGLFGPQVVCEIHVADPMVEDRERKGKQRLAQSTLDSLTHELQHVIQLREGFAFGGNTADAGGDRAYGAAAGEVEARNAARRNDPQNRIRPPWATEDVPARYQSVGYSGWEWTDADGWRPMAETAALSPAAVRPAAEGRRYSVSAPLVAAMQERERRANAPRSPQGESPFFAEAEGAVEIPVRALRTVKDEPERSIRSAAFKMRRAAAGSIPKRAPVSVVENGDGTYTVIDGNATTRAAARGGLESVRAKIVGKDRGTRLRNSGYLVKQRKDGADADGELRTHGLDGLSGEAARERMYEQAEANKDALRAVVDAAARVVGGEAKHRKSIKKRARVDEKAKGDYGDDYSRVVDLIGGTVVMPDSGDFTDAVKAIEKNLPQGASIAKVKPFHFGPNDTGYQDVKVSVRFANGGIGEIILVEKYLNDAKFNSGGHTVYDSARVLDGLLDRADKGEIKLPPEIRRQVEEVLATLREFSAMIYARGPEAVAFVPDFERMKAFAASQVQDLLPIVTGLISSKEKDAVKSSSSEFHLAKPPSVDSYAMPKRSFIQNDISDSSPLNGKTSGSVSNFSLTVNGENDKSGKFSVAPPRSGLVYPQLRSMSDDELLSAAVAVRMALGTSDKLSDKTVKINTVQKIMRRLHPDWDGPKIGLESQRVLLDARKFGKRIREDLDRGVSDSLILEHLPQSAREQFGLEMRQEARKGQSLGAFGQKVASAIEERQARVVEDAVRVQTGIDASIIENVFGIDLSATLMHLAENPLSQDDGKGVSGTGAGEEENAAPAEEKDVEAKVVEAVSAVVDTARQRADENAEIRRERKAHAEQQKKDGEAEGETGDESGDALPGDAEDAVAVAVKKAGLDLENPRHLAEFVAELTRRYWIKEHGLAITADVWHDLVAVQFLRKTAQSVYAKLCKDLVYSRSRETAMQRIAKLDAVPTVAGLLSEMEFVGALINAQRIRDTQKQLCEKLDLFLRQKFGAQGRFKPDKEEGQRSVSAEAELRARYMRHAMWLTPDAAADEARQLQETLDALSVDFKGAGRDRDQSREFVETIRKLNVLREFGALRYKPVGEIEAAAQWWEDFARGESDDIVREMSDRDIRTKKAAHLLAVAFADPKRTTIREGGKADALNRFITGHMGFISLLQDCMRHASDADAAAVKDIVDYISREIQKSGDRSEAEKRRHNDAFHAAVEGIYGKGFNAVMKDMMAPDERFTKYMGVVGGKRVTPTKGRALQLLVSLLQEGRKVQVEDEDNPGQAKTVWEGGYHDNIVKHHREGQAAEIMRLLDPADMNMLKWLGQWYESNRSDLSGVCHSLFGIGVYAELPNYFPVKMMLETQGLEKGQGVGWTIFPKALTPRVRNERDFDTSADIFSMWASRMEEAAQWKHHAQLGLEMRGIFGRAELREAVRANHGASVDELMQGFITDILAGHGAYDRSTAGVQYFSDQIRGWTALCALGGNVGVMAKQTTSIPAFGFEIGLVNTAKYMVNAFTPEGMAAMRRIWDSEQRRTRWQVGSSEAVRNALNQQGAGALKRMFQASMITNKLGDVVPALVVGQGIYRDCLARGMSEEDAMAETWSLVERTQQSGRMENQTSIQRRNKLGRIMFQFLSTQQQYLQYEVRAIREVIARPDSVKRWGSLGRAILLNHFILSSAYYWMGQLYKYALGQEPPEDELKDWIVTCLLGPYGSLFVAGFCCKYTLERAIKGYSIKGGSSMLPMESWLKNQVNDGAKLLEAIFDSDGDTWDNMLEAAGRWMSDSNSTVRDLRKIYRYRVKGEPQRRR